ncbi:MAG: High-affinity nickel transporter [Candidatus Nitrospinota bacterium M3_3B_026]
MFYTLAGLAAGLVHVLSGPDHLAAVAPLATEGRRRGWLAGLTWGIGHTGGVWLVAALALAMRGALPVEALSSWGERLVGAVLMWIGVWGFLRVFSGRARAHGHEKGVHTHAAFGVGTLHGIAGSSHFLGVLPALAAPSNMEAVLYVIAFGAGSIAAMAGFAWAVEAVTARWSGAERAYRWSLSGLSSAAIAVGVFWLVA